MTMLEEGKAVLKELINAGFEAYFIGGMVRDYLLNIDYHDIDITTNASSSEIMALFKHTFKKGIKYSSVTVKYQDFEFEVTTYRIDNEYTDSRHPSSFTRASSLKEDVIRRDFTINSIAMDIDGNIIDYCDGRTDLGKKIIRTINNPDLRFSEDALRMLRACYFAAKLGFTIDDNTFIAIKNNANHIVNISAVRVLFEIEKILNSGNCQLGFKYLVASGLLEYLPALRFGIEWFLNHQVWTNDLALFLGICSYQNGQLSDYFMVTNALRTRINRALELSLVTENGDFNKLILYSYGLDVCLLANSINVVLGKSSDLRSSIERDYVALPIKKTCDLVFKGQDIMALYDREPGYWINDLVDMIKYEVIMGNIPNDYEKIKEFVAKNYR